MRIHLAAAALCALFVGLQASAEERPATSVPDLPASRPMQAPPLQGPGAADLPGIDPPPSAPPTAVEVTPRVFVRSIEIRGNTVLPESLLSTTARDFVDRTLDAAELEALRLALTRQYHEAGYVSSGAAMPDQDFANGELIVVIVEGRLGQVEIAGAETYRDGYLRARIQGDPKAVFNIDELEARLQLLRRDSLVQALHAELRPGLGPGEVSLRVEIVERRRYGGSADFNNYQNPAIGAINALIGFSYANMTGWGDGFEAWGRFSSGVRDLDLRYRTAVSRHDTRLSLSFRHTDIEVVEPSFVGLDITSSYLAGGIGLAQPIHRTPRTRLELGLSAEWRQSRSYLDGFSFSFTDAADRGQVRTSVLRFSQDFVHQGGNQVIAARSTFSFGLNVLGATSGRTETAGFVAWLGQAQWIRRFEPTGMELLARGNVQLAFDPLVPFERFSVGGRYSVRGYRENEFVTDSGYTLSFEARYPLLRKPSGYSTLQVVPFIDVGRGWLRGRGGRIPARNLAGAGLGLVWRPTSWCFAELFYGSDIWDVPEAGAQDLQDHGINFRISVRSF